MSCSIQQCSSPLELHIGNSSRSSGANCHSRIALFRRCHENVYAFPVAVPPFERSFFNLNQRIRSEKRSNSSSLISSLKRAPRRSFDYRTLEPLHVTSSQSWTECNQQDASLLSLWRLTKANVRRHAKSHDIDVSNEIRSGLCANAKKTSLRNTGCLELAQIVSIAFAFSLL